MKPLRFVSWAAVSSLPQAEKISLSEQREINLKHIERHGGKLVADLTVKQSRDIPELSDACETIEAYKILDGLIKSQERTGERVVDVVICYTRSRLGRVMSLIETIAEVCRRNGVIIYETDTPPANLDNNGGDTDLLTGAVRSWKAQSEVEELKRRNKTGMFGKFKKGEFLNGAPWGWLEVYDAQGKATHVVDDVVAQTLRLAMVTLYCDQGRGNSSIAAELNERGLLTSTGKEWTRIDVNNLFRMLWRYAGYNEINLYSRGKRRPYARTKGNWPAIISEEELQRIQAERAARRGKRGAGRAATYRFSLMVYCEYCRTRMYMTYQKRKNGPDVIYATCESLHHRKRNLIVPIIEEKVCDFIQLVRNPATWPSFLEEDATGTAELDTKAASIKEEVRKTEQAILKVDDKLIDGTFDEVRHAHQVRRLRERIEQLRHELTVLEDRRLVLDHANRRLDRIQELAARGMEYLTMPDERAANALLRPLLRIWAKDGDVHRIEIP